MSNTKKKSPQDQRQRSTDNSTLSSIVSDLVRAAIGGNHQDVPDEDLDKYVADMIMKSANNAHKKYQTIGLDAYNSSATSAKDKAKLASGVVIDRSESNGLKTNKRFLSSIIKSTDDHNQALIRAEERKATEMAKELIADLDRRAAERERGLNQGRERKPERGPSTSGRMRMDEIEMESTSAASRSSTRDRSSTPPRQKSRFRSVSPVPDAKDEVRIRGRGSRKYENDTQATSSPSRLRSKMDKYFQEGYDPLLDTLSDDQAVTEKHKKKKREKKDRKSKDDRDHDRRRHKKHKSDRSHGSSSRMPRKDSDTEDSEYADDRRHRRSSDYRGSSSQRRKHHDEYLSDDEKSRSKSSRVKSNRSRSASRTPSRSPSPDRSKRQKHSHNSSRSSHGDISRRKRKRSSDNSGDEESGGHTDTRRSRSRTPPSFKPAPPKAPPREWDLHKINKDVIHAHLFGPTRTRPS